MLKIFLSGGMSGLSIEQMTGWRNEFRNAMSTHDGVKIISPPDLFAFGGGCYEKEAFDYDLYWVRNCDVLVVNLNKLDSIGTAQEIMLAHTLNKPIIMICEEKVYDDVHPWYKEEATRFFLYQSQMDLSETLVDVGNYIMANFSV